MATEETFTLKIDPKKDDLTGLSTSRPGLLSMPIKTPTSPDHIVASDSSEDDAAEPPTPQRVTRGRGRRQRGSGRYRPPTKDTDAVGLALRIHAEMVHQTESLHTKLLEILQRIEAIEGTVNQYGDILDGFNARVSAIEGKNSEVGITVQRHIDAMKQELAAQITQNKTETDAAIMSIWQAMGSEALRK